MTLPPELVREAAVYREAVIDGIVPRKDIVAWADHWLMLLDDLPEALVDVAYSKGNLSRLTNALRELAPDRLDEPAFTLYMRLLAAWYERHPKGIRGVTQALYRLAVDKAVPESVSDDIYNFDDYLDLALDGHYGFGTVEDVEKDVLAFLNSYAS
ncbi:hypothetical protein [Deinococcus sp.]|uniref:hypothetical protein n=1 Tax=Deinococcus sp. TaxID=47478 RepID=UPI003B5ABA14